MKTEHRNLALGAALCLAGVAGYALVVANDDKHVVMPDQRLADYRCTDDCTRDGGYSWAISEGVRDDNDCPDNSAEFWRGCAQRVSDANRVDPPNG